MPTLAGISPGIPAGLGAGNRGPDAYAGKTIQVVWYYEGIALFVHIERLAD